MQSFGPGCLAWIVSSIPSSGCTFNTSVSGCMSLALIGAKIECGIVLNTIAISLLRFASFFPERR